MDIISTVVARHTTSDVIVMDGPCLLGCQVKNGKDNTYMPMCVATYAATRIYIVASYNCLIDYLCVVAN